MGYQMSKMGQNRPKQHVRFKFNSQYFSNLRYLSHFPTLAIFFSEFSVWSVILLRMILNNQLVWLHAVSTLNQFNLVLFIKHHFQHTCWNFTMNRKDQDPEKLPTSLDSDLDRGEVGNSPVVSSLEILWGKQKSGTLWLIISGQL